MQSFEKYLGRDLGKKDLFANFNRKPSFRIAREDKENCFRRQSSNIKKKDESDPYINFHRRHSFRIPEENKMSDNFIRRQSFKMPKEQEKPLNLKRRNSYKIPVEIKKNSDLRKYWMMRYSLFDRFDDGIKLDEESWYSVTPECIARKTAEKCKTEIIIDGFCGAGGNSIQFARTCKKVIAIDIDPKKIELAKHNAAVYGVLDKIQFIVGDFIQLASEFKGDVVFLSPPWGGPSYINEKSYDLESMLQPVPYSKLIEVSRKISRNIAVFLPKNSNTSDVAKYARINEPVQVEKNFMDNRLVAITVYYNNLSKYNKSENK